VEERATDNDIADSTMHGTRIPAHHGPDGQAAPGIRPDLDGMPPFSCQQVARRVHEDGDELRIQRTPGPASHGPRRDLAAAHGIEHHSRVPDGREPRRPGDLCASPPGRNAVAVEPLEAV